MIKSKADLMEDRIPELEDRNTKMLQMEEEREIRFLKNEEIFPEISDSIRKSNITVTHMPEREERRKELKACSKK